MTRIRPAGGIRLQRARRLPAGLRRLLTGSLAAWLAAASVGCMLAVYGYKPTPVEVRDAETGQPIPGAVVMVDYNAASYAPGFINPPRPAETRTDAAGHATLPVTTLNISSAWKIVAPGYIPYRVGCPPYNYPPNIYPVEYEPPDACLERGNDTDPPHQRRFLLYRLPEPTITLVLPDGFRGPLKVLLQPVARQPLGTAGQRNFIFSASADGRMTIPATPLLFRLVVPFTAYFARLSHVQARYANGIDIPRNDAARADATELTYYGLWEPPKPFFGLSQVAGMGKRFLFLVGEREEYDAVATKLLPCRQGRGTPSWCRSIDQPDPAVLDALFSQPTVKPPGVESR